jgi:SNF2 family DNA or RNA helicase
MKLTGNPLPHQVNAIQYLLAHHYCINGDEMGLGKTFDSIAVACAIDGMTLVVSPAFLKYNWEADFEKFTEGGKFVVINTRKDIAKALKANVAIVNYEKLKISEELFEKANLVIADEAHYLKNMESQRTTLFHRYIETHQPNRLHLLTGTPIKNRVDEFYSLLRLMAYTKENTNGKRITDRFRTAYSFARHFSHENSYKIRVKGREVVVRKFEGIKNESELRSYFNGKYIRRKTVEVMDLPELRNKIVYVKYGSSDSDLKEAFEQFNGKITEHISTAKSKSALAKAKFTAEYADNIRRSTGRPVVIFSDHRQSVRAITGYLKNAVEITGSTAIGLRHKYVSQFQNSEIDFIVATIGAMSTGVTLTAANNLVFNDLSWIPAENAQAKKRIHRIGQENACHIHFMAGSNIDRMIITSLQLKMQTIEKVL